MNTFTKLKDLKADPKRTKHIPLILKTMLTKIKRGRT